MSGAERPGQRDESTRVAKRAWRNDPGQSNLFIAMSVIAIARVMALYIVKWLQ